MYFYSGVDMDKNISNAIMLLAEFVLESENIVKTLEKIQTKCSVYRNALHIEKYIKFTEKCGKKLSMIMMLVI